MERRLARLRPSAAVAFILTAAAVTAWVAIPRLCLLGQCPVVAWVGGLSYDVVVARSLVISPSDHSPHGPVTAVAPPTDEDRFADPMAYRLDGIDPQDVLLVRWAPGQQDDLGSLGEFALLSRVDSWADLCPYFDHDAPTSPVECR